VASEDGITVALDITLDDELLAEGTARELVNRIQNLRKNSGLNVTDRIRVSVEDVDGIRHAVDSFGEYIKAEVLADEISIIDAAESGVDLQEIEWLDGEKIGIKVKG
jgi:isoleucyl-tRNA synthetase